MPRYPVPRARQPTNVRCARSELGEERALRKREKAHGLPPWFHEFRPATRQEDHRGIDLVIDSDVGKLYIQIKSSVVGKQHFWERRRGRPIEVVVARFDVGHETISRYVLEAAEELRERFLTRRPPSHNWADIN